MSALRPARCRNIELNVNTMFMSSFPEKPRCQMKIITYLNFVLPATGDHTEPEALCRFRCLDEIC